MQTLEALTRDARALANGTVVLTATETEVARQLQICNACRYCEGFCAVFPGHDAPARIRQGRHPLPGQPVPQLRRLPARLPVRAAA